MGAVGAGAGVAAAGGRASTSARVFLISSSAASKRARNFTSSSFGRPHALAELARTRVERFEFGTARKSSRAASS